MLEVALERGIIDIVQQQFGKRPLMTAAGAMRLALNRFDWHPMPYEQRNMSAADKAKGWAGVERILETPPAEIIPPGYTPRIKG